MNFETAAYAQDKKRKLSQEMDEETMQDKLNVLDVEQNPQASMMIDTEEKIAAVVATPLTMDELERRNQALMMIDNFIKSENDQLKKSLMEMQKENQSLKDVLKNDFQVNYKYINKSYK